MLNISSPGGGGGGGLIFNEGFFALPVLGGLMHGGAYFRDFTVYICFPFHLVDNLYCLLLHDLLFC